MSSANKNDNLLLITKQIT